MQQIPTHPNLILHNARVYTVDPEQPWTQAIAIRKHRIAALGRDLEILPLAGPETEVIDLGGRLVLPGLCDAHIHLSTWALGLRELRLADTKSRAEMLERIARRSKSTPAGDWIVGQGWNESWWGETTFPTAAELDPVTRKHPALFWRSDMHSAVANTAALRLAGIDVRTPDPAGGVIVRDESGWPTGVLLDMATSLVSNLIPAPTPAEWEEALADGVRELHRIGVTAVHAQRIKDRTDGQAEWAALLRLHEKHALRLRVHCNIAAHDLPHLAALGLRTGFGDRYLRLGHVKVFADGSLGSRTAWMLEPIARQNPDEPDNYGVSVTPPEQMAREFRQATELGFPISVHAIGDRANRVVLDIFEELADSGLEPPIPHRIEHAQTLAPADLPRLAALRVTASVQPIHAVDDMDTADLVLGARGAQTYAFSSLFASGALVAFGSDAPVADPNPFLGIHAAVIRQRPERMPAPPWYGEQRVSLEQAIHAYTLGAAAAAGWEWDIGSITVGKLADLAVVDRDLFALVEGGVTGAELAQAEVVMTVFGGEIVYRA